MAWGDRQGAGESDPPPNGVTDNPDAFDDARQHRSAGDVRQHLSGQSRAAHAGLQDGDATGRATLSQGKEVHGLVRRADVAAQGLRLLADETAVGQIYAIGDPTLQRG